MDSVLNSFHKLVWNSSFEIGVGSARSSSYGDIICARYSPRGAKGSPAEFKNNIAPKTGLVLRRCMLRWLNTVLAVCEYMSFAKL